MIKSYWLNFRVSKSWNPIRTLKFNFIITNNLNTKFKDLKVYKFIIISNNFKNLIIILKLKVIKYINEF